MKNLTTKEAAAYLEVSVTQMRNLVQQGKVKPCGKIGFYNLFDTDELDRYQRERRPSGRPLGTKKEKRNDKD